MTLMKRTDSTKCCICNNGVLNLAGGNVSCFNHFEIVFGSICTKKAKSIVPEHLYAILEK